MQTTSRLLAAIAGLSLAGVVAAQPGLQGVPVDLPDGPAKPGFDIERFGGRGGGWFETFFVDETQPLQQALDDGDVSADMRVMVIETAAGMLALVTGQMAYHHLAQGTADGKDWMATF